MIFHHTLRKLSENSIQEGSVYLEYIWEQQAVPKFNELIISWNALRPVLGGYTLLVALYVDNVWSGWFKYAYWGSEGQYGGDALCPNTSIRIFQDTIEIINEKHATGFRVQVQATHKDLLESFYHLHTYTSHSEQRQALQATTVQTSVKLNIPMISQISLNHPRRYDLCSPAATTSVINYFMKKRDLTPETFASQIHDQLFDIFGNWVLNTAQASAVLGEKWHCWVQRLSGFDEIHLQLSKGNPIITSVRGPLEGSAFNYATGHLLVVNGYDAENQRVLCMDPAFPSDVETNVSYCLSDFMDAWCRRGRIAYLITRKNYTKN